MLGNFDAKIISVEDLTHEYEVVDFLNGFGGVEI